MNSGVGINSSRRLLVTGGKVFSLSIGLKLLPATTGSSCLPGVGRDALIIIIVPPRDGLSSSVFGVVISSKVSSGYDTGRYVVFMTVHVVSSLCDRDVVTLVRQRPTIQVTTHTLLNDEDRLDSLGPGGIRKIGTRRSTTRTYTSQIMFSSSPLPKRFTGVGRPQRTSLTSPMTLVSWTVSSDGVLCAFRNTGPPNTTPESLQAGSTF